LALIGFNWLSIFPKSPVNIEQLWVRFAKNSFLGESGAFRDKRKTGNVGFTLALIPAFLPLEKEKLLPRLWKDGRLGLAARRLKKGGRFVAANRAHDILICAYFVSIAGRGKKKTRPSRFRRFFEKKIFLARIKNSASG
jgi:hypothetical protein